MRNPKHWPAQRFTIGTACFFAFCGFVVAAALAQIVQTLAEVTR